MADDKSQRRRFIEKARELECDEDEDRFNANLRRIVGADDHPDEESLEPRPGPR